MSGKRIGLKEVRALGAGETIWDAAVPSFGARRQKGPAVTYVLKFRTAEGRQRWHTIGRHGAPWTPEMAREEARRLLGEVVRGTDPSADRAAKRTAPTVAELCEQYYNDAEAGRLLTRRKMSKKPSTLLTDKGRIQRHIIPLLGRMSVPAVSREDIHPVPVLSVPSGAPESWTEEECVTAFQVIAGGWGSGEFDMMEPSVTVVVHLSERDFTRWIEEFGHTRPDFWIRGSSDVKVPLPEEKGGTAPRAVSRRVRTSLIRDAVTAKLRALIAEGKFTPVALNKMSDAELMYQTGAKRTTAREARTRLLSE